MPRRLSREKEQEILSYNGSITQEEVAKKVGVSLPTIRHVCERNGTFWIWQRRDQYGENNTQYKDGMGRSTIERTTRLVIERSGRSLFICERCGDVNKEKEQSRHHKDRDRSNNVLENLEVLCQKCHMLEHYPERVINGNGQFVA